jgi:hypothetical protein
MADKRWRQPIRSESAFGNTLVRTVCMGPAHKGERHGIDSSKFAVPIGRSFGPGQGSRILLKRRRSTIPAPPPAHPPPD